MGPGSKVSTCPSVSRAMRFIDSVPHGKPSMRVRIMPARTSASAGDASAGDTDAWCTASTSMAPAALVLNVMPVTAPTK